MIVVVMATAIEQRWAEVGFYIVMEGLIEVLASM
jgi:hypothetical protein